MEGRPRTPARPSSRLENLTEDTLGPAALIEVAANVSITVIGSAEGGTGGSSPFAGGGGGGANAPGARGGDGGAGGSTTLVPPELLPPGILYHAYRDGAQGEARAVGPEEATGARAPGPALLAHQGVTAGPGRPSAEAAGGGFDLKVCLESMGLTLDDPRITWMDQSRTRTAAFRHRRLPGFWRCWLSQRRS
jgi:hypothetical protein